MSDITTWNGQNLSTVKVGSTVKVMSGEHKGLIGKIVAHDNVRCDVACDYAYNIFGSVVIYKAEVKVIK